MEVWAKEREVAGLRASLNTLMSEIQRLNKLCAERKEAEDSLKKKWKKIEEFDSRRSELETIYTALLKAIMVRCLSFNSACKTVNPTYNVILKTLFGHSMNISKFHWKVLIYHNGAIVYSFVITRTSWWRCYYSVKIRHCQFFHHNVIMMAKTPICGYRHVPFGTLFSARYIQMI